MANNHKITDISAQNIYEEITSIFIIVLGTALFCYFIGVFTSIIGDNNMVENEILFRTEQAISFCSAKGLPGTLTKAIISHTKKHFDSSYAFGNEMELLNRLPINIRYDIGKELSKQYLSTLNIFDDFNEYIKGIIALKLQSISHNEGQILFERGQFNKQLYIQRCGISIESNKEGNAHILRRGDILAIESFITEERSSTVKCLSWCEYFTLDRDDVKDVLKEYFPSTFRQKWKLIKRRVNNIASELIINHKYEHIGQNYDKYYLKYDNHFDPRTLGRDLGVMLSFEKKLKKTNNKYLENEIKSFGRLTQKMSALKAEILKLKAFESFSHRQSLTRSESTD